MAEQHEVIVRLQEENEGLASKKAEWKDIAQRYKEKASVSSQMVYRLKARQKRIENETMSIKGAAANTMIVASSNKENVQSNQLVTFNEKSDEKINVVLQHPMSTKMIKRNFELNSNTNLRSADSNYDSNGQTMPEDALRGKILTARNGTMSDYSE